MFDLCREDVIEMHLRAFEEIGDLQNQLDADDCLDRAWTIEVNRLIRHRKMLLGRLEARLGQIKNSERRFIDNARRLLSSTDFDRIVRG